MLDFLATTTEIQMWLCILTIVAFIVVLIDDIKTTFELQSRKIIDQIIDRELLRIQKERTKSKTTDKEKTAE